MNKSILLLLLLYTFCDSYSQTIGPKIPWAQEQTSFTFPLYFEDGWGRRDTFYLTADSLCGQTLAQDFLMGSYYLDSLSNIPSNKFSVYFSDGTSYMKSYCNFYMSQYPGVGVTLSAINQKHPVTMSWDTTLFYTSSVLRKDFDFASLQDNYFCCDDNMYFDMRHTSSVVLDTLLSSNFPTHFPITIKLLFDTPTSVIKHEDNTFGVTYKNGIFSTKEFSSFSLFDISGKECLFVDNITHFNPSALKIESGIYIVKVKNASHKDYWKRIIIISE